MNIIIEDNIDFYKELENYTIEDNHDNVCLISSLPLDENHVKLSCGHKFNLNELYKEVCKQKINRHKSMDKNIYLLKKHQFICPYCRTIQHQLLPHIKNENMSFYNGVNSPHALCMTYHTCEYINKSGKNKHIQCNNIAFSYSGKCYCNKHYNLIKKKLDKNILSDNKAACCAILKTGKRKGEQCGAKIFNECTQTCKRHSIT